MKLPQHQNPTNRQDAALAPYNFVALPQQVVEADKPPYAGIYDTDGRFTGQIECSLTTETPLYTRAPLESSEYGEQNQKRGKKRGLLEDKPDFFYVDPVSHQPVIPGSSLRGMLRALIEIVSYAKLEFVGDDSLVYRSMDATSHGLHYRERLVEYNGTGYNARGRQVRLYTPLMQAGYMHQTEKGDWQIQPARSIAGSTFARISHRDLGRLERDLEPLSHCRNAARIYFQPDAFDYKDVRGGFLRIKKASVLRAAARRQDGLLEGSVVRSGPMPTKRSEAVIYPENAGAQPIPIPEEMIEIYRSQISQEQEQLLGPSGVLNEGQPIFYLIEKGELIFFGHTMMMRLPYPHSPKDFVPEELRDPTRLDLAEAIFGYVGAQKLTEREQARAGRIFIDDACLQDSQTDWRLQDNPIIPKVLGSPKPTTFQHYLVQRNPDPFHAGRTRDGRPRYRKELTDYTAKPITDSVVRGHKLYWHKGLIGAPEIIEDPKKVKEPEEDTQHTKIGPVRPGVTFKFSIRFENLSNVELGALLWVLTLPGEEGKSYRHKLGMGKPLGMGSVYLQPRLLISDRLEHYRHLFHKDGWHEPQTEHGDLTVFIDAFEHFILERMAPDERGDASTLQDLARIQMLLMLLEWPGLPHSATRYLEIEREDPSRKRTKINEYRDRPVLPSPLPNNPSGNMDDDRTLAARATEEARLTQVATTEPEPTLSDSERATLVEQIQASIAGKSISGVKEDEEDEVGIATARTKDDLRPGMRLKGRVVRVEPSRVVVEMLGEEATLQKENILPVARDAAEMQERFPPDKIITVYVLRINQRGRIQVTMRRPRST